ncbi:MAG: shikimate dehydrogenase [Rhodospirillales bacterium]|nr:shikimate dehydrogenase [Rhodospirillales bacterium]
MISGRAKLAGVMGWPVSHSLSPRLHGFWLQAHKIDGAYLPLAVAPENLEAALRALPLMGFRGVNLTLPHKELALGIVDDIDKSAKRIGAVNTIVVNDEGALIGSNTDGFGFIENIRRAQPNWKADTGPVVILGAGGATRAICVALQEAGAEDITLMNRTREKAEKLSDEFDLNVRDWQDRGAQLGGAALLINTTSLGTVGQTGLDLSLDALPRDALVCDIVYTPLETELLRAAEKRGNPTVDGLGMLLHQAPPGFAAWFGVEPEVTEKLRRFVLAATLV